MNRLMLLLTVLILSSHTIMAQVDQKPYSNPILIYGSSFGNFFKALYRTGDFNTMMKFTSSQSIKKFGYDNILEYYKDVDFGYDMTLTSRTYQKGVYTLNYNASILGTKKVVRLNVVIENDSAKLVLDNILFHIGINVKDIIPNTKYYGANNSR